MTRAFFFDGCMFQRGLSSEMGSCSGKGVLLRWAQVQKMKVDTESAMLEMDQILRANELSISLVAAVPAFLIAGATLYSIGRWV